MGISFKECMLCIIKSYVIYCSVSLLTHNFTDTNDHSIINVENDHCFYCAKWQLFLEQTCPTKET